jgi:hypothetical protein
VRTVSGGPCCGGDSVSTPKPESMAELAASYALDRAALRLQYDALVAENARLREALDSAPIHLLGEAPEAFIERYKAWFREARHPALGQARAALEAKP